MSEGVERGGGRPARGYDVLLRAVRRATCEQELEDLRTLAYAHYVGGTIEVFEHAAPGDQGPIQWRRVSPRRRGGAQCKARGPSSPRWSWTYPTLSRVCALSSALSSQSPSTEPGRCVSRRCADQKIRRVTFRWRAPSWERVDHAPHAALESHVQYPASHHPIPSGVRSQESRHRAGVAAHHGRSDADGGGVALASVRVRARGGRS